jgi:hypothetical protein
MIHAVQCAIMKEKRGKNSLIVLILRALGLVAAICANLPRSLALSRREVLRRPKTRHARAEKYLFLRLLRYSSLLSGNTVLVLRGQ